MVAWILTTAYSNLYKNANKNESINLIVLIKLNEIVSIDFEYGSFKYESFDDNK